MLFRCILLGRLLQPLVFLTHLYFASTIIIVYHCNIYIYICIYVYNFIDIYIYIDQVGLTHRGSLEASFWGERGSKPGEQIRWVRWVRWVRFEMGERVRARWGDVWEMVGNEVWWVRVLKLDRVRMSKWDGWECQRRWERWERCRYVWWVKESKPDWKIMMRQGKVVNRHIKIWGKCKFNWIFYGFP